MKASSIIREKIPAGETWEVRLKKRQTFVTSSTSPSVLSQAPLAEVAQQERLSVATLVSTGPQSNCHHSGQLAKSHCDQALVYPHEHPAPHVRWE